MWDLRVMLSDRETGLCHSKAASLQDTGIVSSLGKAHDLSQKSETPNGTLENLDRINIAGHWDWGTPSLASSLFLHSLFATQVCDFLSVFVNSQHQKGTEVFF
jgi:hypothetical protein